MTTILRGSNPVASPELGRHTWATVRGNHDLYWVSTNRVLFFDRRAGSWEIYEYDPRAGFNDDPFKPRDAKGNAQPWAAGSWQKRGLGLERINDIEVTSRFVWLENQRMLEWRPFGTAPTKARLWRWGLNPALPGDPLAGEPVNQHEWTGIHADAQVLYLGQRQVLFVKPDGDKTHYELSEIDVNTQKKTGNDIWRQVGHGLWTEIKSTYRLQYLGKDRLLVWDPEPTFDAKEPKKPPSTHYWVYRVDRRGGFGTLVSGPPLAEGLWDDLDKSHQLVFVGDPYARVLDWQPANGLLHVWNAITDFPEVTPIPGVGILREGQRAWIALEPKKLLPGNAPPTISGVAQRLKLDASQVFQDILTNPKNEPMLKVLHAAKGEGAEYRDRSSAAQHLHRVGTRVEIGQTSDRNFSVLYKTETRYEGWGLDFEGVIYLTQNLDFQRLLSKEQVEQDLKLRIERAGPTVTRLKAKVEEIRTLLDKLHDRIEAFKRIVAPAAGELAIIGVMQTLVVEMMAYPQGTLTASDNAELDALLEKLNKLAEEHNVHQLYEPKWPGHADAAKQRDELAGQLIAILEDKQLIEDSAFIANHLDLLSADRSFQHALYDTCRDVYSLILLTGKSDDLLKRHIEPAIQRLTAGFDPSGFVPTGVREFDDEVRKAEPDPGPPRSWLEALAANPVAKTSVAVGAQLFGNTPGPASLLCLVYMVAAPAIMGRLAARADDAAIIRLLSGRLFKTVCKFGNLGREEVKALSIGIASRNAGVIQGSLKWGERMQTGFGCAAVIGLLNVIAMGMTWSSTPDKTFKDWIDLFGGVGGTLSAVAQAITALRGGADALAIASKTSVSARVLSNAKFVKGLGAIAGAAAVVSSGLQAKQSYDVGDLRGSVWAVVGGLAAGASLVGFLLPVVVVGAAFPPLGVILMAVGAVVGVATVIITTVRDLKTVATHKVFDVLLAHFERRRDDSKQQTESTYWLVEDKVPSYHDAYREVQKAHHPGWFSDWMVLARPFPKTLMDLTIETGVERLYDAGMSVTLIAISIGATKKVWVDTTNGREVKPNSLDAKEIERADYEKIIARLDMTRPNRDKKHEVPS